MAHDFNDRLYQKGYRPDLNYEKTRKEQPQVNPGSLPGSLPPDQRALRNSTAGRGVPFVQYNFTATTDGEQVSPSNPNRTYFLIQNNGANPLYVGFDVEPDAATGILIPASGNYEPYVPPTNAIFVFGPSGDTNGVILEGIST